MAASDMEAKGRTGLNEMVAWNVAAVEDRREEGLIVRKQRIQDLLFAFFKYSRRGVDMRMAGW